MAVLFILEQQCDMVQIIHQSIVLYKYLQNKILLQNTTSNSMVYLIITKTNQMQEF
jgi:hypothetical protein